MSLDLGLAAIRELVHVETGLHAVRHLLPVSPPAEITDLCLAGTIGPRNGSIRELWGLSAGTLVGRPVPMEVSAPLFGSIA